MYNLKSKAAETIGHIVLSFSRLDFNIALAIRNIVTTTQPEQLNPLIERLNFKQRLEVLRDLVQSSTHVNADGVAQFEAWYVRADNLRAKRNAFVHGRWGFDAADRAFNTSTKVGSTFSGRATEHSLSDLQIDLSEAENVLYSLIEWQDKQLFHAA